MRALTFHGRRDLRLEELPDPSPGPGELRIRNTLAILPQSAIDLNVEGHFVDLSQPHPRTGISTGFVLGQQFGGVVESVGEGVSPDRVGELVGVAPGVGCGECGHCASGHENLCVELAYHGLVGAHGGLAGFTVVRESNAVPVPKQEQTALLEALLVVQNIIRKVQPWMDGSAPLILGAGPVGLCAATLLRDGYGIDADLYDILPQRRERARASGLSVLEPEQREGIARRVVFDCAGTNPMTGGSAMVDGLAAVDKGGVLGMVGTYLHDATVQPMSVLVREVTLRTSFAYSQADLEALIPMLPKLEAPWFEAGKSMGLEEAFTEGLLLGEVDRDGYNLMVVRPQE